MKIVVEREVLLAPVQSVLGAIEKKTLPIMANLLIQGDGQTVTFTGSDLETTLIARVEFPHEPFAVTLPARRLSEVLNAFPKGAMVGIQVEEQKAVVKSGRSRFQMPTMPVEDYPSLENLTFETVTALPTALLKGMIVSVEHAMAKQDVRYYLNGMLFEFTPKACTLAATDGHRLAIETCPEAECELERALILPSKGVGELRKLLSDDGECLLSVNPNHLRVELPGQRIFISKLIDGKFPDYHRVIPRDNPLVVRLSAETLLSSVQRVALVLEKTSGLALTLSENLLTLKARNSQLEESEEQLEVEYLGSNFEVGLNAHYLMEALKAMGDDEVQINASEPGNSLVLHPVGRESPRCVIMPMRL